MSHVRPAGMSDSSDEDDIEYCPGGSESSFKFYNGGCKETKSSVVNQTVNQNKSDSFTPTPNEHSSNFLPSSSSSSINHGEGTKQCMGRGRGRGRGSFQYIPSNREEDDGQPQRSWCGGARGLPTNNRHRRRSGSNSPTQAGSDKRRSKETLLKKVPGFGTALQQEVWARDASKNLKCVWESDQKVMKPDERQFSQEIQKLFKVCHEEKLWNVPSLALFLVISSSDFLAPQGGKNQAQAICHGLGQYVASFCTSSPVGDPHLCFSTDLQKAAFEAAVFQKKESLLKLILETFLLTTQQSQVKSFLIKGIQTLIENKDYTEACYCATHLRLHSSFDIHAFLVPLIIQDKPAVVEDFLQNSPEHQRQLIKFLDEQFQYGNNSVFGQLVSYRVQRGIPDSKDDKCNHKPISKLIKRLRTKYNLGFDCCPNIGHRQRFGELRHLFSRRYEKNEMSAESFAELIEQLSVDGELKEDIINHYLDYQDYEAAAKFIIAHQMYSSSACQNSSILVHLPEPWKSEWEARMKVNMSIDEEECWDDDDFAHISSSTIGQRQQQQTWKQEESWEPEDEVAFSQNATWVETKKPKIKQYYCHPFPRSSVYIISDPHEVLSLCTALSRQGNFGSLKTPLVSGFDSEWKPILSKTSGAALLQLAFEDGIKLLDLVTLKNTLELGSFEGPCIWKALRRDYFENENILKLGFDLRNDVKMLTETVPQWKGLNTTWKRMLDLSSLKSLILKECPHLFAKEDGTTPSTEGESGLSELVYLCTGQSLSKDEQMSDWEKRPLREPQVLYAASDAYCLISIYRSLEHRCMEKQVSLDRIMENYFKGLANGSNNGSNGEGGFVPSKKKKGSLEVILDLLRLPGMDAVKGKQDTSCVKLVVDTMLLGLGRYLRSLGFDTVMLGNNEGHECCVNYVRLEGRRIITRGLSAYGRIAGRLSSEREEEQMIYLVKSEIVLDQIQEICNHFNVTLKPSRLFTICFRCNTSVFIKVSNQLIFELMEVAGCHLTKKPSATTTEEEKSLALLESLNTFKTKSFDDMIFYINHEEESLKNWTLLDESILQIIDDGKLVLTGRDERVELTRLQMMSHILDQVYVCNGCGKCYWSSKALEDYYKKNLLTNMVNTASF